VVKLTTRDEALIRALGRFRIATSGNLGELFFPGRNRDVLMSRLRKLYDAGFVEVHAPERAAENVYSLGRRGRRWLEGQGIAAGSAPRGPWAHHLGIVQLWVKLAATAHLLARTKLVSFRPEWEIREGLEESLAVIPDAVVELDRWGTDRSSRLRLALEVDRGTEALRVLAGKVQTYASMSSLPWWSTPAGSDVTVVLFLLDEGERRERQVRELLEAKLSGRFGVWTNHTPLVDELDHLCGVAPGPVTASRRGNGSGRGASRRTDSLSDVTGGGLSGNE